MGVNREQFSVSTRGAAVGSVCVAITALVVLAIVSQRQNADTLSVIALTLAILAFVIQIIVFIVQSTAATQQQTRSEEIYGATLQALAEIREKTEGTREAVSGSSARMIEALIYKAVPEAASAGVSLDSQEFSERLAVRISEQVANSSRNYTSDSNLAPLDILEEQGREDRQHEVYTYPSDVNPETYSSLLIDVSSSALMDLWRLAEDYIKFGPTRKGRVTAGVGNISEPVKMYEKGLIRKFAVDWAPGPTVITLSSTGLLAMRFLVGQPLPEAAPADVLELRRRLADERTAVEQLLAHRPADRIPTEVIP